MKKKILAVLVSTCFLVPSVGICEAASLGDFISNGGATITVGGAANLKKGELRANASEYTNKSYNYTPSKGQKCINGICRANDGVAQLYLVNN